MFTKILQAIIGAPAEGQRKIALGTYVITGLLLALIGCILAIVFVAGDTKAPLLVQVALGAITAISTAFGILVAGNVGEHFFKAGKAPQ